MSTYSLINSREVVLKALKSFIQTDVFKSFNNSLILYQKNYRLDFIPPQDIDNIPIQFFNERIFSERAENMQNDFIRCFELDSPCIYDDTIFFKIHHHIYVDLKPPFSIRTIANRLTHKEKEVITKLIERSKRDEKFETATSLKMPIECQWSYIYFKFNCSVRKFEFSHAELKSIG